MRGVAVPVTLAAILLAACHSYKPLVLPEPGSVVGKEVRVQFSVPRDLAGVRQAGGDTVLRFVSAFRGRAIAVSGDTLQVAPTRITDGTGEHPAPGGIRVGVLPDPSVAVDAREFDGARTTALGGGALAVAADAILLALFAEFVREF
jgi:hypothetical protein